MAHIDERIRELERRLFAGEVDDVWRKELAQVHALVLQDPELWDRRETLRHLLEVAVDVRNFQVTQLAGRMAAITLILVINAFIAGIYGMNVALPAFENPAGWLWALFLILLATVISTLIFKRMGWL